MKRRLRILHLEDEPDFAELVRTMLVEDSVEAEILRVGDKKAYQEALGMEKFDLILSDYHLPSFTGLEALAMARKACPATPFILISGTIGEAAAINSLKAGATDYLLKHNPERLASAVLRAVDEAGERAKLRDAEAELARREKYFRTLTENSLDVLSIINREGNYLYVSPSIEHTLGWKASELIGQNSFAKVHPDDLPQVMESFQNLLDHPQRAIRIEYRHQHKNGTWLRFESFVRNEFADPDIAGVVAHSRDVTDRWRAEEELRHSEKQYRLLFHENPNPMWVFDMESLAILEVNEVAVQHYGYSRDEFLRLTMADLRVPDKKENGGGEEKFEMHAHNTHGHIWRHRRKAGDMIEVEVVWSPMAFQGKFAALAMATDVTERRRAEHRDAIFSKLNHRLGTATTAIEVAQIISDAASSLFEWDHFSLNMYSTERSKFASLLNLTIAGGQPVRNAPPEEKDELMLRVIKTGSELVGNSSSNGYFASGLFVPVLRGAGAIGVLSVQSRNPGTYGKCDLETLEMLAGECSGVLERVRVEEALHESQRRFRDIFENSPDAIFVEDLNGNVLDVNLAASQLHGVPREQLIGKNAIDHLIAPKQREQARRDFEKLASGKITRIEGESLTMSGRVVPVEIRANIVQYQGKMALLLHVRDMTERRATQTALLSSETLFRSVWENSADGMRLTDENGLIVAVNEAFCELVGLRQEELEGKVFTIIYAATENVQGMLEQYRNNYLTHEVDHTREYHYTLHNGREVILEVNNSFIELHGQPQLTLSLFRDITAQRRLEEQFRQAQKMEAIGQLAGGVAHDFNNILTVIQGHASLLAGAKLSELEAKSANQIVQAAARAAGLTRQLLTFSRRQLIQPKRLDMNKIVGNMTNMVGRLLGEDIALQLNYCQAPPIVEADAGMMEQILLNLAVNARDAMPKGGQLGIRITVTDINDDYVASHPDARKGSFICISVSDTGTGIAPENLSRIFEPFFTTKEIGKGTGLGLATVYGIVKQHQGWIQVDSHVGRGTAFRIFLPRVSAECVVNEKPTTAITVRGGNESILLVEDERPVRELVARVLERYGYKIFQADNGTEALEIWGKTRDKIKLVLTDLVMPNNMNGRELAEKLWSEEPDLKVIFTSGYSADIVGKDFKIQSDLNFLQKPYQPQVLALAIRRCLDGKH
jgi:PAS domain S-box-containing protein